MVQKDLLSLVWIPGQGPDPDALHRMTAAFPKPARPMGEAWFMAPEREMYPQLLEELDAVQDGEIENALEEIASGTISFGRYDEWVGWYHYLLPRLVERRWSRSYYQQAELLFTAFMAQHPDADGDMPYPQFTADALATLGRYIMSAEFWPEGQLDAVRCLSKWTGPTGIAGWFDAGGLLSASLFFCMKYLPSDSVDDWFSSVITIPNRYWQVQILTWLVGAHSILSNEIQQPAEFPETSSFNITWSWSHVLRGDYRDTSGEPIAQFQFLPDRNRESVLRIARRWEVENFIIGFMTDPETQPVASEIIGMPERFFELYRATP
jgi:hypothetical protein